MNKKEESGSHLEEVRAAAATFADPEHHDLHGVAPPLSKRALASIFEESFTSQGGRGLAYPEEIAELGAWLAAFATCDRWMERHDYVLATVGAWQASAFDAELPGEDAHRRDLVRAIASYFLRQAADTATLIDRDPKKAGSR